MSYTSCDASRAKMYVTITNNSASIIDICILAKIGRATNLLSKFFKMDEFKDCENFEFIFPFN